MKCTIVAQNYPPENGSVRYPYILANELNNTGNKISVITGVPNYPSGKVYNGYKNILTVSYENGVEVIRVPVILASNEKPLKRILSFISFLFSALPQIIKKRKSDLFIISVPPYPVIFLGVFVKLFFGIPHIILLRDFEPYSSFNTRGMLKLKFFRVLCRLLSFVYKYADAIAAVHADQLETLTGFGITKNIKILPHPFEAGFLRISSTRQKKKEENKLLGLYAGTFGKIYALPSLIELLSTKKIADLPIKFIFIGEGEDVKKCRKIINEAETYNVEIIPEVPHKQVIDYINCSDFLVYSIKSDIKVDGTGAKFYEYLAAGKPVFVCGKGTALEIVKSLGNGWYIDKPDNEKLYECLKKIINSVTDFEKMGIAGRDYIRKKSDISGFIGKWNELCGELINQNSSLPNIK